MQGFDPIFIVFVVIGLVAAAAVAYQPSGFSGGWKFLASAFGSDSRPSSPSFRDEHIEVAGYARFDVEIDDEHLWMMYDGPSPAVCPPCMQIPLNKIRFERSAGSVFVFQIEAAAMVRLRTRATLGDAIARRVGRVEEKTK